MIRSLLLSIFMLSIAEMAQSQTFVPYTFEGSTPSQMSVDSMQCLWQIGTPSKTTFDAAFSPTNAIVTDTLNPYPDNADCFFQLNILLSGVTDNGFSLSFDHRYETELQKDGGWIEVYDECAGQWIDILDAQMATYCIAGVYGANSIQNIYGMTDTLADGRPAFTGSSNGWINTSIDFYCMAILQDPNSEADRAWGDSLRMRFHFRSDGNQTNQDGWMIDNFLLSLYGGFCSSVEEYAKAEAIEFYPNPAADHAGIRKADGQSFQNENLIVSDMFGRIVLEKNLTGSTPDLDLQQLAPGIYTYTILKEQKPTARGKFIHE